MSSAQIRKKQVWGSDVSKKTKLYHGGTVSDVKHPVSPTIMNQNLSFVAFSLLAYTG